jgi:hypothetical protein
MPKVTRIDGLPVVDAKRPLTLKVTKADIAKAADSIQQPNSCAVARACHRELHCKEVRVHLSRVYVRTNDHNWVRYLTPKDMRGEIIAFDRGGSFEPGEFRLAKVPPTHALGTPRRGGTRTDTGKKRRPYHLITNVRGGPATQS